MTISFQSLSLPLSLSLSPFSLPLPSPSPLPLSPSLSLPLPLSPSPSLPLPLPLPLPLSPLPPSLPSSPSLSPSLPLPPSLLPLLSLPPSELDMLQSRLVEGETDVYMREQEVARTAKLNKKLTDKLKSLKEHVAANMVAISDMEQYKKLVDKKVSPCRVHVIN